MSHAAAHNQPMIMEILLWRSLNEPAGCKWTMRGLKKGRQTLDMQRGERVANVSGVKRCQKKTPLEGKLKCKRNAVCDKHVKNERASHDLC